MSANKAQRQRWWWHTLLVAGVLGGLLSMHGLTAGHDTMQMPAAPTAMTAMTVMAMSVPALGTMPPAHKPQSALHDASPSIGVSPLGLSGPNGAADRTGIGGACLAVAAAVVSLVMLIRTLTGRHVLMAFARRGTLIAFAASPWRACSVSLTQLGICRT